MPAPAREESGGDGTALTVRGARRNKDRMLTLPAKVVPLIRARLDYARMLHKPDRGDGVPGMELPMAPAKIPKKVTVHTLRHSFTMHLLMRGVNIRSIRDTARHTNVQTTENYTHVV